MEIFKRNQGGDKAMNTNRTIAETIAKERSGVFLVETIEYYLNELDRLEKKEGN